MKREKEFKEYLKNKLIDFAPCIEAYEDYNLRITEVLDGTGRTENVVPSIIKRG